MQPTIKTLPEKKIIGMHMRMSLTNNRTHELWKGFIQRRREIKNNLTTDLFSMQVYDPFYDFKNFNLSAAFEKWAAVEVADFNTIPDGMESYILTGGLYAVFIYKGDASGAAQTFQYIFGTWLPNSGYLLDNREHFEILGEKYKNNSPDSEEEIWVPIKIQE